MLVSRTIVGIIVGIHSVFVPRYQHFPLRHLRRNAKAKDRPYKLSDAEGLFLLIQINGSRLWRFAYRFGGKQKLLALGAYPAVRLYFGNVESSTGSTQT